MLHFGVMKGIGVMEGWKIGMLGGWKEMLNIEY
jgi:hypothetical protein